MQSKICYRRIVEKRLYDADALGKISHEDIGDNYVKRVTNDVKVNRKGRKLKIVVDAGNGIAGIIATQVLQALGVKVIPLNCTVDGTFPNHHPDPSEPENLEDLINLVMTSDADLGIAFDGDGDRLGVVTNDGENIFPDRLLMLFAADILKHNPGAVIIYDVKCTGRLEKYIQEHSGSPLMWKTGHSLIKAKMREVQAVFAGEMSGHFFFSERWYGFDDGIYSAARLIEILSANTEHPSEQLKSLPNGFSTPEIKVPVLNGNPHDLVQRFIREATFIDDTVNISTIDGLRADWPNGWGLVRASNTTPILVMRFDADSQQELTRIQAMFREQLLALFPDLSLPF